MESAWADDGVEPEHKESCPPGMKYFGPSAMYCHVQCEDPTAKDPLYRIRDMPSKAGRYCLVGRYDGKCDDEGNCIEVPPGM